MHVPVTRTTQMKLTGNFWELQGSKRCEIFLFIIFSECATIRSSMGCGKSFCIPCRLHTYLYFTVHTWYIQDVLLGNCVAITSVH